MGGADGFLSRLRLALGKAGNYFGDFAMAAGDASGDLDRVGGGGLDDLVHGRRGVQSPVEPRKTVQECNPLLRCLVHLARRVEGVEGVRPKLKSVADLDD
ncbi:MAG: hypothetical protein GY929_08625 [Actinomycetia bacterium]|nr:hypothetical protein [Actinomycetes bacterium]